MLSYVKLGENREGFDFNRFYCVQCGSFLTTTHHAFPLKGAFHHSHVNPAGIRCDFMTFAQCENVVADSQLYEDHSWFSGYAWRFLFCSNCLCHVGWRYDPVGSLEMGRSFYGLLASALHLVSNN